MKDLVDTFQENNLMCPECGDYDDPMEIVDDEVYDSDPEFFENFYNKCGMCGRYFR